jgi:hypothetical protein
MLGAFEYYKKRDIPALQIVPDNAHWTIDVPDMSAAWSASSEPLWRWLEEPWTLPVPKDSTGRIVPENPETAGSIIPTLAKDARMGHPMC